MIPQKVAQFFSLRGIDPDTLKHFGIWWNGKEIVIPVKNILGKTLFNKYRRDPESTEGPKYRYETGAKQELFNYDPLKKTVIITEGELDCIRLYAAGYHAVSGTGGASSFSKEFADKLRDAETVYICYDADSAGTKGAVKVASMLSNKNVRIIAFPTYFTGKDITDYLQHHTAEEFKGLIKKAFSLPSTPQECAFLRRELKAQDISQDILEEHLAQINQRIANEKRKIKKAEINEKFESIKGIPISSFVDFNGAGFTQCLWHNERTPSLKYYKHSNSCYCFGQCGRSYDVISVIRKLHNYSFLEALDYLQKYL